MLSKHKEHADAVGPHALGYYVRTYRNMYVCTYIPRVIYICIYICATHLYTYLKTSDGI